MSKTIEEKARAYDKALAKAREYWEIDDNNTLDIKARGTMEYLFSELTESNDEKTRKEILEFFQQFDNEELRGVNISDWIAWLEKQGEKKPYGQRKECLDCQFNYAGKCKGSCAMKRNEQNLENNYEPKYREGNFIKHNKANVIYKVISVNSGSYYVENIDTNGRTELFNVEQNFHLWSIEDAKDGDILYSLTHNLLWIYKSKEECHAAVNLNYANSISFDSNIIIPSDVRPAIKEQCDLLFQKMKEAGYEWNAEKKELKKVENHPLLSDFFNAEYERGKADALKSTEWSEEDELQLQAAIEICENSGHTITSNWLKSLKNRVYPKQEWTKEDKERYISCLQRLGTGNLDQPETINSKWFKEHVYPQKQWKPNNEQMCAFKQMYDWYNTHFAQSLALNSLYNDLKKLKGE